MECILKWSAEQIFGLKEEEVTRSWRKLHNVELCNMHSSANIRLIMRRIIRWERNVTFSGTWEIRTKFWSENLKGRNRLGDLVIHNKVMLKWILHDTEGWGLDLTGSGLDPLVGICEYGNTSSNSIKCRRFIDQLINFLRITLHHGFNELDL
jgi:hypothetical protein